MGLLRLGLGVLGIALLGGALDLARGSSAGSLPPPMVTAIDASGPAVCFISQPGARQVRFWVTPKAALDGATSGKGKVGILLAHQADANMCQWSDYADFLVGRGYRVLAFTFSLDASPPADDASVVAAARTLKQLGAKKIVLMGASRGGTAVLGAAGKQRVAGVVALSAPATYNGVDALVGAEASRAPLLLAVGQLDSAFVGDEQALYRAAKGRPKQLIVKKASAAHGVDLLQYKPKALVDKAVLALLARIRRS